MEILHLVMNATTIANKIAGSTEEWKKDKVSACHHAFEAGIITREEANYLTEIASSMLFISAQRLRNLTTGRLHTKMDDIYQDLELITGEAGIMTHMLGRVNTAIKPWLETYVTESRFWDNAYDPSHTGEVLLPMPTPAEREQMFKRFGELPNPLAGKKVIALVV